MNYSNSKERVHQLLVLKTKI